MEVPGSREAFWFEPNSWAVQAAVGTGIVIMICIGFESATESEGAGWKENLHKWQHKPDKQFYGF